MTVDLHLQSWRSWYSKRPYSKADTSIEENELGSLPSEDTIQQVHPTGTAHGLHHGWRRVVIRATIITTFVLLLNVVFATVAVLSLGASKGVGNIFSANCLVVKRWNTALHLLINVLGTILLAASSFTMQCLASPTRHDADVAHAKGVSLDIGIPSARNLLYVRYWKGIIWMTLSLSTIPLHLFWNSTIFTTMAYNQRGAVTVDEKFLAANSTTYPYYIRCPQHYLNESELEMFIYKGFAAGNYTKTSRKTCEAEYFTSPLTTSLQYRNFIFVSNKTLNFGDTQCTSTTPNRLSMPREVPYCYTEVKGLPECTLHYSSYLMYIVATCNMIKVICMFVTAKMLWNDGGFILATVGDATASFLEFPDHTTLKQCITNDAGHALNTIASVLPSPAIYERKSRANMVDTMRLQWALASMSCIAVMAMGTVLVIISYHISSTMHIPTLSAPDGIGFVRMNMASNSPQLILSITYFCCNSFLSAQCASKEWAAFARIRKPLRVTWPRGQQRSTYWLSLPYRYSIPFTGLMLLLHFVLSQSVFIGRSEIFDSLGNNIGQGINGIISAIYFNQKYSFTTFGLGFVLITCQFYSTYATLSNRIPCHGNSSAMISAMCHMNDPYRLGKQFTQDELKEAAAKPLMWGATRQPFDCDGTNGSFIIPGHCSFSPDAVEPPIRGKRYE